MPEPALPPAAKGVRRRRRSWRRRALAGLAALLLALVLAAALAWSQRLALAGWAAGRAVESAGLGPARFVIVDVGIGGIAARDISLAGGAIEAASLKVAYSLAGLLAHRIDRVELARPRVTLVERDGLPALPAGPPAASGPASGAPAGDWRIDAVVIEEARIEGALGGKRYAAAGSGKFSWQDGALRDGSLALDLDLPVAGARRVLHLEAPKLSLAFADGGAALDFADAALAARDIPWRVERASGALRLGATATATFAIGKLASLAQPPLVHALGAKGEASLAGGRLAFALEAEAAAAGGKGALRLAAKGGEDLAKGSGEATVSVPAVRFAPGRLQPADLFPVLGASLPALSGSVALSGRLGWRGAALAPDLVLRLADLAFDTQEARVADGHGEIRITGLAPPATAPGQVLAATLTPGGLPASAATLAFQLRPDGALAIERAHLAFAGGAIETTPFLLDPRAPRIATALEVSGVELGELLELVGLAGLSGSGRIGGRIPLALDGGRVTVHDGRLAGEGPGVLHFRSDALPASLASGGKDVEAAIKALEDFRYDSLALELESGPGGEGTALLHLGGSNPAVEAGRRFNFNIRLESDFDRLTALALRSMSAMEELLRRSGGKRPK